MSQLNPTTKTIYHASVNACLAPLVSVDGKHVITVEGIGNVQNPHPTQERIAMGSGSQCGFCTPGIVMVRTLGHRQNFNGDDYRVCMLCCGMMLIHQSLKLKKLLMVIYVGARVIAQFLTQRSLLVRKKLVAGRWSMVRKDVVWRMVI